MLALLFQFTFPHIGKIAKYVLITLPLIYSLWGVGIKEGKNAMKR